MKPTLVLQNTRCWGMHVMLVRYRGHSIWENFDMIL